MATIQFQYFPKNKKLPDELHQVVDIFIRNECLISSFNHNLKSNEVLSTITSDLKILGYDVEINKSKENKIIVPVLFGINGKFDQYFEADGYNPIRKTVIEVEAGRGVTNYQFLKDIFQACMMHNVDKLVIAVRNTYRKNKDFETVIKFLDTLYASDRLALPLEGILIIGY